MNYNTELPDGFKSWNDLLKQIAKELGTNSDEVIFTSFNYSYRNSSNISQQSRFKLDFIKARCFEELKKGAFSVSELDKLIYCIMTSYQGGGDNKDLIHKMQNMIEDKYTMGDFE